MPQLHTQAFISFLKTLAFKDAFAHAADAGLAVGEVLQLFPELCADALPEPCVVTPDVLGRNVKTLREFVMTVLKQQSADPSSITPDSAVVQEHEKEARVELAAFLQRLHDAGKGDHVGVSWSFHRSWLMWHCSVSTSSRTARALKSLWHPPTRVQSRTWKPLCVPRASSTRWQSFMCRRTTHGRRFSYGSSADAWIE